MDDHVILKNSDGLNPVVYRIEFNSTEGLFEMSEGYTAYPGEDEVLIQDGLEYTVKNVEKVYVDEKQEAIYTQITLQYPANK